MGKKLNQLYSKGIHVSVLLKLTISYLILILLLAITIGFSSYHLSTTHYNKEVIKLNNQLLQQYSRSIQESILTSVEETRQKIVLNINVHTDIGILYEDHLDVSKISTLYKDLKLLVGSSKGKYDAIHAYSKKNNLILSSTLGLEYLEDSLNSEKTPTSTQWIKEISNINTASSIWIPTTKIAYSTVDSVNVMSYITSYPSHKSFKKAKGFIKIDLNEDYLSSLLKNIDIGGKGQLFLIDSVGHISSHSDSIDLPASIQDIGYTSLDVILESPSFETSVVVNNVETIISYVKINNSWMLVRAVPVDEFYAVSKNIALLTTLICLVIIFAAALIAKLFVSNIYAPLSSITLQLKKHNLFGKDSTVSQFSNEYEVIHSAIKNYDSQLSILNKQWADNIVNLKQNILRSIMDHTLTKEETFIKRVQLIGHSVRPNDQYNVMYIKVENTDFSEMIVQDIEPVIYSIISFIENLSDKSSTYIASQAKSNTITTLIMSLDCNVDTSLNKIVSFTTNVLSADISLSIGKWREHSIDAHYSYQEALIAYGYHFFLPLKNIFNYVIYEPFKDEHQEKELDKLFGQFSNFLKSGDSEKIQTVITVFIEHITTCNLPLENRYDHMYHIIALLRNFTEAYFVGQSDVDLNFSKLKETLQDIYEYEEWLTQATHHILELKKNQSDRKLDDIIYNIKQYIRQNLADDLSLTILSEYTTLSNSYLSHIFKETTGVSVVEYITEQRMDRAKTLLETSSLNIELVASACGFGTPHYFSKKFKQYFGLTPRSYRIAFGEKKVNLLDD